MTRSTRNRTMIRAGIIGFLAGVAALGVVATAAPMHRAVSQVVVGVPAVGWQALTGEGQGDGLRRSVRDDPRSASQAQVAQPPASAAS